MVGDYDGDGRLDTLKEHFTWADDQSEETFKMISTVDLLFYQEEQEYTEPFLADDDRRLTPVWLESAFGLLWAETLPDLNEDGASELGIVLDHAGHTNLNTYQIYTYAKGRWVLRYQTEIRGTRLPDLPHLQPQQAADGTMQLVLAPGAENQQRLADLQAYQYAKEIAPKTLELHCHMPNECRGFKSSPVQVETTGAWFQVKADQVPWPVSDYWAYWDWSDYKAEDQAKFQKQAKAGPLTDWCEGGGDYKIRLTF